MVENLLASTPNPEKVILDCADISIVSSGFADEVFGRLFLELGPQYHKRLVIKNANRDVMFIINRAIVQRWETHKEMRHA